MGEMVRVKNRFFLKNLLEQVGKRAVTLLIMIDDNLRALKLFEFQSPQTIPILVCNPFESFCPVHQEILTPLGYCFRSLVLSDVQVFICSIAPPVV